MAPLNPGGIASFAPELVDELWLATWEARHSLFIRFLLYGGLFAALVIAASPAPARARQWVIVVLSLASIAVLGNLPLAGVALAFSLALYGAIELVPGATGAIIAWALIATMLIYPVI